MTEYTRAVEAVSRLRGEAHSSAAIARTNIDEDADTILAALDSLRWRKVEEELPEDGQWVLGERDRQWVLGERALGERKAIDYARWSSRWWEMNNYTRWRPIGPEPGE